MFFFLTRIDVRASWVWAGHGVQKSSDEQTTQMRAAQRKNRQNTSMIQTNHIFCRRRHPLVGQQHADEPISVHRSRKVQQVRPVLIGQVEGQPALQQVAPTTRLQ